MCQIWSNMILLSTIQQILWLSITHQIPGRSTVGFWPCHMWRALLRLPWNLQPLNLLKCNLRHMQWLRWRMSAIQHGLCWASNWKQRLMFVYVCSSHDQVLRKLKLYETLQWLFIVSAGTPVIPITMDLRFWLFEISMALLRFLVWMFTLLVRRVLPFGCIIPAIGSDQFCAFVDDVSLICNTGVLMLSAAGCTASFGSCSRTRLCLRWQLPRGELLKYLKFEFSVKDSSRYKLNTHENSLSGSCLVFNFEVITSF